MMKIALCLFGYFDSLQDDSSKGIDGFKHINENILTKGDVDVFIHNWQPSLKEQITNLYKPKRILVEEQVDFSEVIKSNNILNFTNSPRPVGSILSQCYSRKMSLQQMDTYSKDSGTKYDCVILSRFDLGRINRNSSIQYPVQCINFDKNLDMDYMYCADWHLFNEGPADMWFYSNSKNMEVFKNLYDLCIESFVYNSDYFIEATSGWFDSKNNDFTSNEIMKPLGERSKNLHKYPEYMTVNGVLIIKWLFKKYNIWEKTKFLKTKWE